MGWFVFVFLAFFAVKNALVGFAPFVAVLRLGARGSEARGGTVVDCYQPGIRPQFSPLGETEAKSFKV